MKQHSLTKNVCFWSRAAESVMHCKDYDFENRYKTRNLIDNDYLCVSKIAMEINFFCCRNIMIPARDEKIVELSIIGDTHTLNYIAQKGSRCKKKYFHVMCNDVMNVINVTPPSCITATLL